MKKDQLRLKGTLPIIIGMCLMLAPLDLIWSEVGILLDFFGFLLITSIISPSVTVSHLQIILPYFGFSFIYSFFSSILMLII